MERLAPSSIQIVMVTSNPWHSDKHAQGNPTVKIARRSGRHQDTSVDEWRKDFDACLSDGDGDGDGKRRTVGIATSWDQNRIQWIYDNADEESSCDVDEDGAKVHMFRCFGNDVMWVRRLSSCNNHWREYDEYKTETLDIASYHLCIAKEAHTQKFGQQYEN